jgi:hypothetical protein
VLRRAQGFRNFSRVRYSVRCVMQLCFDAISQDITCSSGPVSAHCCTCTPRSGTAISSCSVCRLEDTARLSLAKLSYKVSRDPRVCLRAISNERPQPPCCSAACRFRRRQAVAVRYAAILVLHLQMAAMQMTQQACNFSSARSPPAPMAAPPAPLWQHAAPRPAQHSLRASAPRASRAARRQAALLVRAVAAAPQAPASKGSTGPPPST